VIQGRCNVGAKIYLIRQWFNSHLQEKRELDKYSLAVSLLWRWQTPFIAVSSRNAPYGRNFTILWCRCYVFTTSFWQHVRGRRFYRYYRCCNYVQSWQHCTCYGISEFYQKETKYSLCAVSVNIYRLKSIIERMWNQFKGVMLLFSYVTIKAFFTHNYLTFIFLLYVVISYQWAHFFSWKCFIYSKLTIIVAVYLLHFIYYALFIMLTSYSIKFIIHFTTKKSFIINAPICIRP